MHCYGLPISDLIILMWNIIGTTFASAFFIFFLLDAKRTLFSVEVSRVRACEFSELNHTPCMERKDLLCGYHVWLFVLSILSSLPYFLRYTLLPCFRRNAFLGDLAVAQMLRCEHIFAHRPQTGTEVCLNSPVSFNLVFNCLLSHLCLVLLVLYKSKRSYGHSLFLLLLCHVCLVCECDLCVKDWACYVLCLVYRRFHRTYVWAELNFWFLFV